MYKKIINWLMRNYCDVHNFRIKLPTIKKVDGKRKIKIVNYYGSMPAASRILFPFFLAWGATKYAQMEIYGEINLWWVDAIFAVLALPQIIASFSQVVVNEYHRLNKE